MKADIDAIYAKGIRLSPEAYDFLDTAAISAAVLEKLIANAGNEPIISKETIESLIAQEEKIPVEPVIIARAPSFKPIAKEYSSDFRVLEGSDLSGKSNCTGKIDDFVGHFRNRFERIQKVLRSRLSENSVVPTNKLKATQGDKVRLIAIVTEKRVTKKGNILLDVEDEEGNAKVVIMKDTAGFKACSKLMLDDIVAFDGKNADELFISDTITWPEIPLMRKQKRTEKDIAIVYLSDLHFGSKKFLENDFSNLITWLNGAGERQDLAGKVKYIIVGGDVVDGIGIYPEQEKELAVKDIYKQYEMFDEAISKLPDYIEVIVGPGNHDAVRRADPQPPIPTDLIHTDVTLVGSPSQIEIEGLRHLVYHGTSLDSIIAGMTGLSYSKPEDAMLELIRRRHLSPIYGDNLIVPESHDYMVMDVEPDIVHMGHVHKNGYMMYRGTLLINSGTFQDRTDYQVKMGHVPTPGMVPILEGKSGKLNVLDARNGKVNSITFSA
ncbi:MAG: DNA-directed DNA polymerase II small subunit [Candidatus Micrarchaeota archaeon]|nr:DNA-directed DNA polymerase II small subunit [Candidatus Micrarchaeota archaeon]